MSDETLTLSLKIPFSSEKEAEIAYNSIAVDPEPSRSSCTRTLKRVDNFLDVTFKAVEAKHIRISNMNLDVPDSSPAPTPSRANYGFVLYLSSKTAFYIFLTWSLMPASLLPLVYLPQVYWAVAIPSYCLVALALVGLLIYPAMNLCMTPPPEDCSVLTDSQALPEPPPIDREVPAMYDIPMTDVSRILYLDEQYDFS